MPPVNHFHLQREREITRLSDVSVHSKQPTTEKASAISFQSRSPTSWSVISEHQTDRTSSQDNPIDDQVDTPPRTFRLPIDEVADRGTLPSTQYVFPASLILLSHRQVDSSSQNSSLIDHTYPFTFTPDFDSTDNQLFDRHSPAKAKSDECTSPAPTTAPKKKQYSSPPPPKVTITSAKDEVLSTYDSDDGWSDDSAELLYVDERYAREKRKTALASHLASQQPHRYSIQQPNVLLQ